jgi:hypothetical protein
MDRNFPNCTSSNLHLLGAKNQCDFLWIGITQYIIENLAKTPIDQHRSEPTNNPLTYFERSLIIRKAMVQAGVDESQFAIIPFPRLLNGDRTWKDLVPPATVELAEEYSLRTRLQHLKRQEQR